MINNLRKSKPQILKICEEIQKLRKMGFCLEVNFSVIDKIKFFCAKLGLSFANMSRKALPSHIEKTKLDYYN